MRHPVAWLAVMAALASFAAQAQQPLPARTELAERAARRFPQPVRVGALVDRRLLAPSPRQPVLGRVVGPVRSREGQIDLLVRTGGWFGIGTKIVAVPIEAVALLGEHVALLDLTPEQLAGLPAYAPSAATEIPADEDIRVGLAKPFH